MLQLAIQLHLQTAILELFPFQSLHFLLISFIIFVVMETLLIPYFIVSDHSCDFFVVLHLLCLATSISVLQDIMQLQRYQRKVDRTYVQLTVDSTFISVSVSSPKILVALFSLFVQLLYFCSSSMAWKKFSFLEKDIFFIISIFFRSKVEKHKGIERQALLFCTPCSRSTYCKLSMAWRHPWETATLQFFSSKMCRQRDSWDFSAGMMQDYYNEREEDVGCRQTCRMNTRNVWVIDLRRRWERFAWQEEYEWLSWQNRRE